MSVQISGVLKDGAGKPVPGCSIRLNAKKTSPTVVVGVISSTVTDANGHYSIEAEPGYYIVSLVREGFPPILAGDIYVAPTDVPDTLNAFLDAPKDADLRPEVMKRFEEMVNRVVDLSGATEKDRERAEQARDEALTSRNEAVEAAETAATDAAEKAAGKVSEQLKAAVADDTQRAEAAMAGAESAAAASQGYRDEARAAAAVATTKAGEASASAASADTARTAAAASAA
ncbi:TPA: prophage tail fiber N-terminal domain-containing protein, partial [Klebsiella pneumoniae]